PATPTVYRSRAAGAGGARLARIALWLFLSLLVLYVGVTRGHFIGTDEIAVYQATRSLWHSGNLSTGELVNTYAGRAGLHYSVFSAGQSVAALPLYGLSRAVESALIALDQPDWVATFAGPGVGREPSRWGGDIGIFFVGLFNTVPVALLCSVLFAFSLRLGASVRASLFAAGLLGLTSYVVPSAVNFLQHASESLFLLWTFYFLFQDARRADWRPRLLAGITLALAIALRWESVIAVPWLGLYLLWSVWDRREADGGIVRAMLRQLPPFVLPLLGGLCVPLLVNWLRWESVIGLYGNVGFNSPFPVGLYTFLFSSGDSVFLYTPLLILLGRIVPPFVRTWRREAILIAALSLFYLFFYASYRHWHGLWSDLGPRFLIPTVPFLLLPLANWLDAQRPRAWLLIGPLALIGLWVQFVHIATNFSYVSYYEKYIVPIEEQIPWDFLFLPQRAPILAHTRAVFDWDYRVDMWWLNTLRTFGTERALLITLPLLACLALCVWRLMVNLRETTVVFPHADDIDFTPLARPAAFTLGGILVATILAWVLGF
ncbi:MAG: phospholipid carrier-dependent glycosyltransferase, partial [Chloroflexota bacterium]